MFVRKGKNGKTRTTLVFNDPTLWKDLKLYLEERQKKGIDDKHLFLSRSKEKYVRGDPITIKIKSLA